MRLESLQVGHVYFMTDYYDEELLIPKIGTYIYLGQDLLGSDGSLYFQSAAEYFEKGIWSAEKDAYEHGVVCMKQDILEDVFDYTELQHQLELMKKGGARYYE